VETAFVTKILDELNRCPARDLETQSLEFKSWCKSEKELSYEISEATVCLANTSGGLVIIGVNDKGTGSAAISPCPHASLSVELVKKWVGDLTKPPVECNVTRLSDLLPNLSGTPMGDVMIIEVTKTRHASGHRTNRGVSLIRVDTECRPDYFTDKDDYTALPLDSVTLDDLSLSAIQAAIKRREDKYPDVVLLGHAPLEHLKGTNLLTIEGKPSGSGLKAGNLSVAALLLFGKEDRIKISTPAAETIYIVQTSPISPLTSSNWYNLQDAIHNYLPLLRQHLAERGVDISEHVFFELLLNAYLHRCYRTPAPVQITIGGGELEIRNPGGLLGSLTSDTLLYEPPQYRNFLLVDAARQFGYCEKAGSGIDKVYHQLIVDGFDFPIFESGANSFKVIIKTHRDKAFAKFIQDFAGNLNLKLTDLIVLRTLRSRNTADISQLCKLAQRPAPYVQDVLHDLQNRKLIVTRAGGRYALSEDVLNQIARYDDSGQLKLL
jgi:ATP-dependent DNA helicase RecG